MAATLLQLVFSGFDVFFYTASCHKQKKSYGNSFSKEQIFIFFLSFFFKILFIFREGKGERKGEKHQCMVAS